MCFKGVIKELFNVDVDTFISAIRLSPNAQGYISGAITEILLKRFLEKNDYEVLRIREKWEGTKHPNHHGDFYVREKDSDSWFVLESKGLKSNSEKWHKLYNKANLIEFLNKNILKTQFKTREEIEEYIRDNLPKFENEYSDTVYTFNEVAKYLKAKTRRKTEKSESIEKLRKLTQRDIDKSIEERIDYVNSKIRLIETHLVSGGSEVSERTQATPRKDEFHILALDLFLKTGKHEFIFINPLELEPSSQDTNHLQQNYLVTILVDDFKITNLEEPWNFDFEKVFSKLRNPVKKEDMQIDERLIK